MSKKGKKKNPALKTGMKIHHRGRVRENIGELYPRRAPSSRGGALKIGSTRLFKVPIKKDPGGLHIQGQKKEAMWQDTEVRGVSHKEQPLKGLLRRELHHSFYQIGP